jgi:hypothetical protein
MTNIGRSVAGLLFGSSWPFADRQVWTFEAPERTFNSCGPWSRFDQYVESQNHPSLRRSHDSIPATSQMLMISPTPDKGMIAVMFHIRLRVAKSW